MYGDRFMESIAHLCFKLEYVGEIRRGESLVSGISIICVPLIDSKEEGLFKDEKYFSQINNHFDNNYPGIIINGSRYKKMSYKVTYCVKDTKVDINKKININLYITDLYDYGRIKAIRTGSAEFMRINYVFRWARKGYVATEFGLYLKDRCVNKKGIYTPKKEFIDDRLVFETEQDFYEFLDLDYVEPNERNWKQKPKKNVETRDCPRLF